MKKDIFALLQESLPDPTTAGSPPVLNLWRVTTYYLMFFTLHPEQFASHFDKQEGAYLCLGEKCPACKAGDKATMHVYLPVWDAQNRRVAILKFDTRPDGPAVKILQFLQHYQNHLANIVAVIECKGRGEFSIIPCEPLPETDRGALACQAFSEQLEAGTIDLHSCVKRLTPKQIVALASMKTRLAPVVGKKFGSAAGNSPTGPGAKTEKEV
jgi:hypothetical protein